MRQLSWNRQLGLALALFALGSTAYWLEYSHRPATEATEEQAKHVFQIKDSPIQSIRIQTSNQKLILTCSDFSSKLCKPGDNSKWEIAEPMKLRADDSNVNSLVSTLNTLTSSETINLKEETAPKKAALLKEYGLDPESRKTAKKIEIVTGSGSTILYLGLSHPIGDSSFGVVEQIATQKPDGKPEAGKAKAANKLDEDRVFLIPSFFKANLDRGLSHWRDKKLLGLGVHEIESFKYEGPQAKVTAERKDGQWILHSNGEEFSGDTESIDSFLTAAVFVTAKDFTSDQKNDAKGKAALKGLKPAVSLLLQKEKGSAKEPFAPVTLTFYQKGDPVKAMPTAKVYATVSQSDPLYEVDAPTVGRVTKSLKDFRLSKLLTSMDRFGAKRVEFSGKPIGTPNLALVQHEGKWVNSADQSPVANEKVMEVLDKLSGNRIQEFLSGSTATSQILKGEADGLIVSIGDDKAPKHVELVFWESDGKLYGRDLHSKRKEVFKIDPIVKNSLPWKKDFFKPAEVKPEPKAADAHKKP